MLKKLGVALILISILTYGGWYWYELRQAYIDHAPYIMEAESEMIENFHHNKGRFEEFQKYSSNVHYLENFFLSDGDQLYFTLTDTQHTENHDPVSPFFYAGEDEVDNIQDIVFTDTNSIRVLKNGAWSTHINWKIYFSGNLEHHLVNRLISYHDLSPNEMNLLVHKLRAINCKSYSKKENIIKLIYRGFSSENLSYVIPLNDSINRGDWKKIEDNFYLEHYDSGLNCDIANWYVD